MKHVRFDWAIKRLLRQKANFGILEGFLSELLKEDIEILEILESESNKATEDDKFNRVDLLVKDRRGELIIIEIQNSYALDYFLRILYGISKVIIEHVREGDTYARVRKIISVNIVYFELGQGDDYIYKGSTTFRGLHDNQLLELTEAQRRLFMKEKIEEVYPEIYLIKVNKFNDEAKDTLDEWIYFLKNSEIKQEFSAKGLKEADEVLKRANMSDQERRDYQHFVEILSDRASAAMTISFEAELLAEKRAAILVEKRMAEVEKEVAERMKKELAEKKTRMKDAAAQEQEGMKISFIKNLLKLGNLSDEQIADMAQASVELVRKTRQETKG